MTRSEVIKRPRDKVANGGPVIEGGVETGPSAKSGDAAGRDFSVVDSSGRYWMDGHSSMDGPMPDGDVKRSAARPAESRPTCWWSVTAGQSRSRRPPRTSCRGPPRSPNHCPRHAPQTLAVLRSDRNCACAVPVAPLIPVGICSLIFAWMTTRIG